MNLHTRVLRAILKITRESPRGETPAVGWLSAPLWERLYHEMLEEGFRVGPPPMPLKYEPDPHDERSAIIIAGVPIFLREQAEPHLAFYYMENGVVVSGRGMMLDDA